MGVQDAGLVHGGQDHRPVGGVLVRGRFRALDGDLDSLVGPALVLPGAAALPVELVLDAPAREAGGVFSVVGGGVERDAPDADLLEYHHVVVVRIEAHAGAGRRELQGPGHEAPRWRQLRAGRGWKLGRVVRLADLDIEVVALSVLGDHDHAGQHEAVCGRARVEQLRMVVAAQAGVVIAALQDVAHENARALRLRRRRPEEHAAQRQQGHEQQWEGRKTAGGGHDLPPLAKTRIGGGGRLS